MYVHQTFDCHHLTAYLGSALRYLEFGTLHSIPLQTLICHSTLPLFTASEKECEWGLCSECVDQAISWQSINYVFIYNWNCCCNETLGWHLSLWPVTFDTKIKKKNQECQIVPIFTMDIFMLESRIINSQSIYHLPVPISIKDKWSVQ